MQIIKPPKKQVKTRSTSVEVFLAGSIEMGAAPNWQEDICDYLAEEFSSEDHITKSLVLYNPRRDDWDSSWEQDINNTQFFEQVSWELDRIEKSDIVVIYLDPETKSPISLLELGKVTKYPEKVLVCCPEGFWRKGNVDITCYLTGIPVCSTMSVFKVELANKIRSAYAQKQISVYGKR